jgi:hypothetical protein
MHAQIEEEPAVTTSTVTGTGVDMPHLRIKTQPVTQESVGQLIALQKNLPDEVLSVLAKVSRAEPQPWFDKDSSVQGSSDMDLTVGLQPHLPAG